MLKSNVIKLTFWGGYCGGRLEAGGPGRGQL